MDDAQKIYCRSQIENLPFDNILKNYRAPLKKWKFIVILSPFLSHLRKIIYEKFQNHPFTF